MGPVEYLIIEFPGNQFNGDIVPSLVELTENGTIRIIDLLFIKKDADGSITALELEDLGVGESAPFDDLDGEMGDLLNEEDIELAAATLANNSSAAVMVFENVWATRFQNAVLNSNGRLVDNARIPAAVVQAALAATGSPIP